MKLKLLDLFSGIGGFSLGLESTGYFETIGFVEKDKFCQKVLKKNFNNIPIESEIRNVKGERYAADIITGGFPCQPFSIAGKRKGTDDDRYLWDETIRIVRECKPRWFIGENVEGLVNIQDGMVLRQVCTDLEKEGFEVQCLIIPASGIGAWHQRKRVWIIANSNSRFSIRENKEIQTRGNTSATSSKDVSNSNSFGHRRWGSEGCANREWSFLPKEQEGREVGGKAQRCDDTTSNTNSKGLQRHGVSTDMETKQRQIITERSIEEQQTWWEAQSKLCRTPNGISYELDKDRTNRIKSLGNSIVPLIVRQLGLAIMESELND